MLINIEKLFKILKMERGRGGPTGNKNRKYIVHLKAPQYTGNKNFSYSLLKVL